MLNPLRLPIVQVVLVFGMLVYVHAQHRERLRGRGLDPSASDERIALRLPAQPSDGPSLAASDPIDVGLIAQSVSTADTALTQAAAARSVDTPWPGEVATEGADGVSRHDQLPASPGPDALPPIGSSVRLRGISSAETVDDGGPSLADRKHQLGPDAFVLHRVVDGDTLRRLAYEYLGDEARYLEIFAANRDLLVRPDLLPLGEKLRIPTR